MPTAIDLWGLVLLAGLLSFLSPCVLPLVPAYLSAMTPPGPAAGGWAAKLGRTAAFAAGVCAPFFLVGLWAGSWLGLIDHPAFLFLAGALALAFGAKRLARPARSCPATPLAGGAGRFPSPRRPWTAAFALGLISSFGWTSCSAPLLAAILALSAGRRGLAQPAILLTLYGLGVTAPFFLLSLGAHGLARKLGRFSRFQPWLERAGGLAMAGLGLWLLWDNRMAAIFW
jgi:cytochrome c biogenesis protein CcdA